MNWILEIEHLVASLDRWQLLRAQPLENPSLEPVLTSSFQMALPLTYIRTQFLEINLKVSSLVPRSARSSNISAVVEGIREAYIKRATKHCDKQNPSHYHQKLW